MAYVVGDNCVKCKHTDCVAVCPVDCFYEGANMLVINPFECIDCGACESECPTTAIFEEADLPASQEAYKSINAVFSGDRLIEDVDTSGWPSHLISAATTWPSLVDWKMPLPGADAAANETNKIGQIDPKPGSGS